MQTSMLNAVQHFYPDTWSRDLDYSRKRYHLIDVPSNSLEYQTIQNDFNSGGLRVKFVKRIQNPYAFGTYLLRKEQLKHRNNSNIIEKKMYHAVVADDLHIALEYNLDARRYNNSSSGKCPKLYEHPYQAINSNQYYQSTDIIICKVITSNQYSFQIESECDAERLPEYAVKIL